MKNYIIYKITNKINNKIYVGCHITENINDNYFGSGTRIKRAIKKYGKENFQKEILFVYNNKEDMLNKEAEIVNNIFIKQPNTYNIIVGGGTFLTTDLFCVKDKSGYVFLIHKDDPRYINGDVISIHKNKVVVIHNGKYIQVDKNDPDYLAGKYTPLNLNKICVIDSKNNKFQIETSDERFILGELKAISKGKFAARNKITGEIEHVNVNDIRRKTGEIEGVTKNKVLVIDKNGKYLSIDKNDDRLKNKEVKHFHENKVSVTDTDGNQFLVERNNPKYLSGEYISTTKNKVLIKTQDGKIKSVSINDPKYISGEYKFISLGRKQSIETKEKIREKAKGRESKMKNRITIHNNILQKVKIISNTELEKYLLEGWILGGKIFSIKKYLWIVNEEGDIKRIKNEDLHIFSKLGYKVGRKFKH